MPTLTEIQAASQDGWRHALNSRVAYQERFTEVLALARSMYSTMGRTEDTDALNARVDELAAQMFYAGKMLADGPDVMRRRGRPKDSGYFADRAEFEAAVTQAEHAIRARGQTVTDARLAAEIGISPRTFRREKTR